MKEVTRIFTVELIEIREVKDEDEIIKKEIAKDRLEKALNELGFDNAVVTNVQDFIRDEE